MDFETREDRQPQGRKKLTAERATYFRLMQQGVCNTEACRIVRINRRTGKRRRYGRGASGSDKAAPPMTAVEPPSVPSRYLSEADRLREKATVRAVPAPTGPRPSATGPARPPSVFLDWHGDGRGYQRHEYTGSPTV